MRSKLVIYPTIFDVAELCGVSSWTIERLCRCGIHPPWHWTVRMPAPRFHPDTLSEWARILDTVPLDSLPENPPPLKRPEEVIERPKGPAAHEVELARKFLGLPAENPDRATDRTPARRNRKYRKTG